MTQHTFTPWRFEDGFIRADIYTSDGNAIASTNCNEALSIAERNANAAHIVKCVNAHDALFEALKALYLDRCTTQDGLVVIQASDDLGLSAYKALKLAGAA